MVAAVAVGAALTGAAPAQAVDYFKVVAEHSRKCLDVRHASVAHGAPVIQGDCWNGANQLWRLVRMDNGYYQIRVKHTDKCLDVAHASRAHDTPVVQGNCSGFDNQHWRFESVR